MKQNPYTTNSIYITHAACATISLNISEGLKPPYCRRSNDHIYISTLISAGSFSNDYLAKNKAGKLIIKSDLFKFSKNAEYLCRVDERKYKHHHIENVEERLASINKLVEIIF